MNKEQMRLIYSSGVIASFFAYSSVRNTFASLLGHSFEKAVFVTISISAVSCFIYLLLTASKYKHVNSNQLMFIRTSPKQAGIFYDFSLDIYVITPMFFLLGWEVNALSKHFNSDISAIITSVSFILFAYFLKYGWALFIEFMKYTTQPVSSDTPRYQAERLITGIVSLVITIFVLEINIILKLAMVAVFLTGTVLSSIKLIRKTKIKN
jgi:hypothetical protein